MKITPDRVISVTLSDEDWRAFVATHPEPVRWLKQQIAKVIAGRSADAPAAPHTAAN